MSSVYTSAAKETAAKAWMHDAMVLCGVLPQSQRKSTELYFSYYNPKPINETKKICDELINRDFANIDKELNYMSQFRFYPNINEPSKDKRYSAEEIAKVIVYMAECFNLYWDDTIRTPYEIEEFKKTLLGSAVYKYGRYISAITPSRVRATKSTSNSGSSNPPRNDFKQQGPKSGQARGLIGKPGEKVYIQDQYALAICGEMPNVKSKYCAQIKPLDKNGASGSTNKVFISASHSYGMGICYFDEMADAQAFYDKLVKSGNVPSNLTKLEIVNVKKDKNGYFLFDTEFGVCAISASVLNEDINTPEVVEEDFGAGWAKATESYTKEQLKDLHTWMRKD